MQSRGLGAADVLEHVRDFEFEMLAFEYAFAVEMVAVVVILVAVAVPAAVARVVGVVPAIYALGDSHLAAAT